MSKLDYDFYLGSRKLTMSYGLLSQVSQIVETVENIPMIVLDGVLRDSVLQVLVAERNADGKVVKEADIGQLTQEEAMDLSDWASEHLLDFFMKLLDRQMALQEKYKDQFEALASRQKHLANHALSSNGLKG